jgi:hypothetical protein
MAEIANDELDETSACIYALRLSFGVDTYLEET